VKRAITILLLHGASAIGFSQSLSLKGTAFRRSDLDIKWSVQTNAFPHEVWVYRALPNRFSPEIISNLLALCSFAETDKTKDDTNWLVFQSTDKSRRLGILFPLGSIEYEAKRRYGPTNLVQEVPTEAQALKLATDIFPKLGVKLADIEKQDNGTPNLHVFDSVTTYFVNNAPITNTEFRGVRFRRAVDGALYVGAGVGGNCEIRFGDHGKVCKLSVSWRNLEKQKSYETVPPDVITQGIREGKAVQGMLVMGADPINWKTVKSVMVTAAKVCYNAGDTFTPSDWLIPFAALWTTVDTGKERIEVEIDCPLITEQVRKSR
jgi:hypothetical protein